MMELTLIWSSFAVLTAVAAKSQGRSFFLWLAVGILLGPFGFIVMALVLSKHISAEGNETLASGIARICSLCAEPVHHEAAACARCGGTPADAHKPV